MKSKLLVTVTGDSKARRFEEASDVYKSHAIFENVFEIWEEHFTNVNRMVFCWEGKSGRVGVLVKKKN